MIIGLLLHSYTKTKRNKKRIYTNTKANFNQAIEDIRERQDKRK